MWEVVRKTERGSIEKVQQDPVYRGSTAGMSQPVIKVAWFGNISYLSSDNRETFFLP
jgi:hypothetical protein